MGEYKYKLPDIGEGVVEAEITAWHVSVGDSVEEDAPIADAMTDKATIELTAPISGVIKMVACEEGDMLAVGADLVIFETEGDEEASGKAVMGLFLPRKAGLRHMRLNFLILAKVLSKRKLRRGMLLSATMLKKTRLSRTQ